MFEEDTEEKHRELVVPDGNQVLAPEEGAETDSPSAPGPRYIYHNIYVAI